MTSLSAEALLAGLQALHPVRSQTYRTPAKVGLVIVDVVNGFCTPGAGHLAPAHTSPMIERMIANIDGLARQMVERGCPVYVVRDEHRADRPEPPYPPHCIRGSGEEDLVPALAWLATAGSTTLVTAKDCINLVVGSIDADGNNGFFDWIRKNALEAVIFTGICTDICLVDPVVTLLSARNHETASGSFLPSLTDIVIYEPGCATYDLSPAAALQAGLPDTAVHDAAIAHYIGLWTMKSRGALIAHDIELGHE